MAEQATYITPEIRRTSEVLFHRDNAPGLRFLAIDASKRPGAPIYLAVRRVDQVPDAQGEYIDWHVHSVDSLYVFLGDGENLTGLSAVVRTGDEETSVQSPMTVFIPKGCPHCYKLTGGSGTYLSIVLSGDYNSVTSSAAEMGR